MVSSEDPRLSFRPLGVASTLAAVAAGTALVQFHPGSGAVAFLDWGRLLVVVVPTWAVLFAAERVGLRRFRSAHRPSYPPLLPVLVLTFGVAFALVALVNCIGPSRSRAIRPEVREVLGLEWRAVTPVGDPLPSYEGHRAGRPTGDGIAVVASWRAPGEELQLPLDEEAYQDPRARPAPLEVREADGFLGVPYVASVRFVEP